MLVYLIVLYSECVPVALAIHDAMLVYLIVLYSMAFPAVQHISTLAHKQYFFGNI